MVAVPAVLLVQPGAAARSARPYGSRVPAGAAGPDRLGGRGGGRAPHCCTTGGSSAAPLAVVGWSRWRWSALLVCAPRLLPAGFLRAARGLPTVIGLRGLASAAFVGAEVVIPLLLSRERGFEPTAAGLVLTVGARLLVGRLLAAGADAATAVPGDPAAGGTDC